MRNRTRRDVIVEADGQLPVAPVKDVDWIAANHAPKRREGSQKRCQSNYLGWYLTKHFGGSTEFLIFVVEGLKFYSIGAVFVAFCVNAQ
jgi:hypothetical protein